MSNGQEGTEQLGRGFDKSAIGNLRRYWFVGGFGGGILGVGGIQHWGWRIPDVGLILLGGGIVFAVLQLKQRGDWDV